MDDKNELMEWCRKQRHLASTRFGRAGMVHVWTKSHELGRMKAYEEMLDRLAELPQGECQRQECKQRMELIRQVLVELESIQNSLLEVE